MEDTQNTQLVYHQSVELAERQELARNFLQATIREELPNQGTKSELNMGFNYLQD